MHGIYGWCVLYDKYNHVEYCDQTCYPMPKKTDSEYISRYKQVYQDKYVLQDKDKAYKWVHVNIDTMIT